MPKRPDAEAGLMSRPRVDARPDARYVFRMKKLQLPAKTAFALFLAAAAAAALAAAPVATAVPKEARRRIASAAEAYRGVPYRFGGLDRAGLDCSGLVFLALRDAMGERVPRTVRDLHRWADPVARKDLQSGDLVFFNTTGPLAHVGIYLGEDDFVHAASDGPKTGVIVSSLDEPYWRRAYAGAGRMVPPAEYLGIALAVSGGASFLNAADAALPRGASFAFGAAWDAFKIKPGLELRPEWDASLGVLRVPLTLSVSFGEQLSFFAGPALVFGDPSLEWKGGNRGYAASGGLLASGGVRWSPFSFKAGASKISLFGELAWQRYEPDASEPEDFAADVAANFRATAGVRVRWGL